MNYITKHYEVVVVGGGLSGVCAAIAAARGGCRTALVQNRPVLGGNASSEVKMHINGAGRRGHKDRADLQETGIVREILHATKYVNPQNSFNILDMVMWEKTEYQENLDLYLNTQFLQCKTEGNRITEITATQLTTETEYTFTGEIFVDTTGDAVLAYESGADWTIGREARATYNEEHAPEVANKYTMGSTLMFTTKDMGHKVSFKKPSWAYTVTKEKLANREIVTFNHGYWWIEVGGDDNFAVIEDAEKIRDELYKWVFGVFDYIKNSGDYPQADNLALDWICAVPGRRESRRIIGDYVLNENDVYHGVLFPDTIGYGGWTMDDHSVGGINATVEDEGGTIWRPLEKRIYGIPYRCLYSRNIDNLYVGGRAISASHMAMSSTRVMATCGILGEAIGTACIFAIKNHITPREVGKTYIKDLQQLLMKNDCYLPGVAYEDKLDLCQNAVVTASSTDATSNPQLIVNGHDRNMDGVINEWISQPMSENGEWVNLHLAKKTSVKQIRIKFDPDLTRTLIPTLVMERIAMQVPFMPYELVKDYDIQLISDGKVLKTINIKDNIYRLNVIDTEEKAQLTDIKLIVKSNYGDKQAKIFEIRAY